MALRCHPSAGAHPFPSVLVVLQDGKHLGCFSPYALKKSIAFPGALNVRAVTPSSPQDAQQESQDPSFWFYYYCFISIRSKGVDVMWIGSHTTS